jgi:hypothetical protein
LSGVVAYKTYASNLIVYVTYAGSAANQAAVMVLSNQTDKYLLQSLPRDPNNQYLLNMTQYNGTWYYVCAADSGNKVYIYRNPLSRGNPGNSRPITPQMSLSLTDPEFATFSTNARFIGLQSGKRFVVYDAEQNSIYRFTSPLNIVPEQPATWLDGQRFSVVTDSQARIFDFDGTNQQTLTASLANQSAYFDNSYHYVYTLVPQVNGKISFEYGQLVAK